jgi:shikimate dehydrogenase
VFKDGQIIGDNTDGYGFIENLKSQIGDLTPHLDHCFIIGAGGAAKAIFYALKEAGAKRISITNRNRARAETYDAKIIDWEHKDDALSDVSLLVNTTSLGMQGQPALAISLDALPKTALVTDIVYQPLMTALINNAQARGNKTVTGIGMLIHQAVPGFEAWFGQKPDVTSEVYALLQNRLAS